MSRPSCARAAAPFIDARKRSIGHFQARAHRGRRFRGSIHNARRTTAADYVREFARTLFALLFSMPPACSVAAHIVYDGIGHRWPRARARAAASVTREIRVIKCACIFTRAKQIARPAVEAAAVTASLQHESNEDGGRRPSGSSSDKVFFFYYQIARRARARMVTATATCREIAATSSGVANDDDVAGRPAGRPADGGAVEQADGGRLATTTTFVIKWRLNFGRRRRKHKRGASTSAAHAHVRMRGFRCLVAVLVAVLIVVGGGGAGGGGGGDVGSGIGNVHCALLFCMRAYHECISEQVSEYQMAPSSPL